MRGDLETRRDLGRILDDSFALYREHWRTLLAATALVVVPVQLGVLGVGLGWLWSGYDNERPLGETATAAATQFLVITPLVTAMAIHVVVEAAAGRRPAAGETINSGLEVFSVLFPVVLVVAFGVGLGLLAALIPGIFLAVRWVVVPQAVVIEGRRGGEALRRSWDLVRGHGWWTLMVLVVINLLVGALSVIFLFPGELLAKEVDAQGVVLVSTIAGQVATLPLLGLGTTLLYFTLRAGPGAPAPPPPTPAIDPITSEPIPSQPAVPDDAWERRRREGWEPPGS